MISHIKRHTVYQVPLVGGNWEKRGRGLYKQPVLRPLIHLLEVRATPIPTMTTLWISRQGQGAQTSILRQSVYSQTVASGEASLQIFKQSIVNSLIQTAQSPRPVAVQTGWNVYFSQQLQLVVLRQRVSISFLEENSHKQKPLPCWLRRRHLAITETLCP